MLSYNAIRDTNSESKDKAVYVNLGYNNKNTPNAN
jgi:hypothetical protein